MSSATQRIRGTQDIWGEEADRFQAVVAAFERVTPLFGFGRVQLPMFEATRVFARTLGETTDVVAKEMYTFEDRGGDSLTLRPEFTAGMARAFISEGWQQHVPLKLCSWGAAFRYERPQKGRFRQFHQLDAEIIGAAEPAADVETIGLAQLLIEELGLAGRVTLKLNTLGDQASRESWRTALVAHFTRHRKSLSPDSVARLDRNPLRILDSKEHCDWPIADTAPLVDDHLTPEASAFFAEVTAGLDAAGIAWTRDARLVRGMDYYRHTAFEFVTEELGAQSQVIGGGRYDGLIEAMGGPPAPAVGFASGIERLAMLIATPAPVQPDVALVPLGERAEAAATGLAMRLRRAGISCESAFRGNMKKRMARASASGARFALIIGDDELDRGEARIKDMASGEQNDVPLDRIEDAVRR